MFVRWFTQGAMFLHFLGNRDIYGPLNPPGPRLAWQLAKHHITKAKLVTMTPPELSSESISPPRTKSA